MPCSSRRSVSRRQPEWLRLQARTDDSRESTPNTWAAPSTSKARRAALVSKVAVLGLHVNSTLTSSDASGGSGDQVPCTGSSGRRESAYWREPSATDGRQSVTRTGSVALLDPAARSKVSHSPTTPGASLTTVRVTRTGRRLDTDVAEDADGALPGLADVEAGVPAPSRLTQFAHGFSQGNWSAAGHSVPHGSTDRAIWLGNSPVVVTVDPDPLPDDASQCARFWLEPDKSPSLIGWHRACRCL